MPLKFVIPIILINYQKSGHHRGSPTRPPHLCRVIIPGGLGPAVDSAQSGRRCSFFEVESSYLATEGWLKGFKGQDMYQYIYLANYLPNMVLDDLHLFESYLYIFRYL